MPPWRGVRSMLLGRWMLFLYFTAKMEKKATPGRERKSGAKSETSAELGGHPPIPWGPRLGGEGNYTSSASVIFPTGINREWSARGANRGGSCPTASGISWPRVCEILQVAWFKTEPCPPLSPSSLPRVLSCISVTSQYVLPRVGRALWCSLD